MSRPRTTIDSPREPASHVLEIRGLVKHFGHIKANDGVDIDFHSAEIHALLGENGAGKSTLIKILAGVYQPDSGTISLDGEPVTIDGPLRAREYGIAVVHQHTTLVPRLTVFENVMLLEGGLGRLDRSLTNRLVDSGRRLGFDLDPNVLVERLTPGDRQRVEIARALMVESRFIILDEPTTVLAPTERAGFFDLLVRLAGEGVAVIFVTHHLKEALEQSHRLTVLRLGKVVGRTDDPSKLEESQLVKMMVGDVQFHRKTPPAQTGDEVLRVERVSGRYPEGRMLHDVSLIVRAGEVIGIAGVEGNGQRELAALLTGGWAPERGSVQIRGQNLHKFPPRQRAELVADVPDDHALATVDDLTLWENIGLTRMAWQEPPTPPTKRRTRHMTRVLVHQFDIRTPSIDAPVSQLSGGNRRRVVLARELSKRPAVVVLSFATKGLDVRSAEQVKQWTRGLAREGAAVVYIASDLEEILDISDRIAVLAQGRITGVLEAAEADLQAIGRLMLVAAADQEGVA